MFLLQITYINKIYAKYLWMIENKNYFILDYSLLIMLSI